MKEKLYTIELTDAVKAGDECPFCWLERKLEQESLEFVLGSSYMESDVREQTSEKGFCRHHTKMMYDYGNTLGNAWILKSRMERMNRQFQSLLAQSAKDAGSGKNAAVKKEGKGGIFGRMFPGGGGAADSSSGLRQWLRDEESHCYICQRMDTVYRRVLDTFAYMLQSDREFAGLLLNSKGFCLHHFADVLSVCEEKLKPQEQAEWIPKLGELTGKNLDRIQEDIDWLIEKYDYRNKDADWKNSRDAVQRTMQKLTGGHPADPVFQCRK